MSGGEVQGPGGAEPPGDGSSPPPRRRFWPQRPFRLSAALGAALSQTMNTAVGAAAGAALLLGAGGAALPDAWNPLAPLDLRAPSGWIQSYKTRRAERDPALCAAALARAGATAARWPDFVETEHCGLVGAVRLQRLETARLAPVITRCAIAMRLYRWEREVVQPFAEARLGVGVTRIRHIGAYSCRKIAGSPFWSQHAQANALDVTGFDLADGRRVDVETGWGGADLEAQAFLRDVHLGACRLFSGALGPDYNAAHYNHFHYDLGRWRVCG